MPDTGAPVDDDRTVHRVVGELASLGVDLQGEFPRWRDDQDIGASGIPGRGARVVVPDQGSYHWEQERSLGGGREGGREEGGRGEGGREGGRRREGRKEGGRREGGREGGGGRREKGTERGREGGREGEGRRE